MDTDTRVQSSFEVLTSRIAFSTLEIDSSKHWSPALATYKAEVPAHYHKIWSSEFLGMILDLLASGCLHSE